MKISTSLLLLFCLVISTASLLAQSEIKTSDSSPFAIGESFNFDSKVLDENRTVNIYLPNGYHKDSLKQYPVIYLLDGSNDEDFIHIAGLVQFCSFSWINIIPETIVVGISNVDRKKDFTYPTTVAADKTDFPTTGSSANFMAFLETELQPLIDKKYNVNDTKTIIGQSLGGLLATEILFKKPDLFDNYIIVSPSLWWDDESLLKAELPEILNQKSVYIGVGKEGPIMERVANELFQKLDLAKLSNVKLDFGFFEKQNHGDTLHLAVYEAFEKLFKTVE